MMNSVSSANAGDSKPWPVLALNAVLFQGLWFAAIFQHPLVAAMCLLALVMQGLVLRWPQKRWLTLCGIAGGGIAVDSMFMALGWYQFPHQPEATFIVPLWLLCLWFGFAFTLPLSLRWSLNKPVVAVVLFAVAGPISYAAGRRLGALDFDTVALVATSALWAAVGGLSAYLANSVTTEQRSGE